MTKMAIVVVCVDDEATILKSLRSQLRRGLGSEYRIEIAESGEEALEIFAEITAQGLEIPLLISDYIMPTMKGDELLIKIHENYPKTLNILLTGQANIEAVGNAVNHANLYRYISKPWDETDLRLTIKEALRRYQQDQELSKKNLELEKLGISLEQKVKERTIELEHANLELSRLANLDGLTQIANRRRFDECLAFEWQRHLREQQPLALIMIDIDYFKYYNDYYGHQCGDDCLIQVAKVISLVPRRRTDFVARYGGEEFVVILPNTKAQNAMFVAESIRKAVFNLGIPHEKSKVSSYVTLSLGIASIVPSAFQSLDSLITKADESLYAAKKQGRNRTIALTL
jgi:diguanylate cyclase (GGDEF)-like protein